MGLLTRLAERRATGAAQDTYVAAETELAKDLGALIYTSNPLERQAFFAEAAKYATTMADIYTAAFGPSPMEHEDGRDMATSTRHVATLFTLLATVENSLLLGFSTVPFSPRSVGVPESEAALIDVAHGPLCEMAGTDTYDTDARYRLLEKLYDAVEPVIGGQAAEALWCLPGPGFVGWTTNDERDHWHTDRGEGRPWMWRLIRRCQAVKDRFTNRTAA